ncbi:MAG: restriction endonuclease subunit S, partial [Pirellulaceae bacterium]
MKRIKALFREKDERSGDGEGTLLSLTRAKGIVPQTEASNRIASTEDLSKYKVCRPGDLVMNRMQAWSGMFALSSIEGVVSPDYSVFGSIGSADVKYFEHLFKTPLLVDQFAQRSKGIGSGFNRLYTPDFGAVPVVVPPLPEQAAIVRYLDYVDRRIRRYIRAKQKLIGLLEELKAAIIHRAVTRGLPAAAAAQAGLDPNVRIKHSGVEWLGEVPEHWGVVSLGMAVDSIQTGPFGSQLHASEYVTGGIPIINPCHLRDGRIESDPAISVSQQKTRKLIRHQLYAGDIVAARRGELGRCALVTDSEAGWLCGTGSLRIRPKAQVFNSAYLLVVFGSQGVRDTLSLSSIGATMDNLNSGMVARLRLPCPPLCEQKAIMVSIASETATIHTASHITRREVELLREYRTRLIADVVTGKL